MILKGLVLVLKKNSQVGIIFQNIPHCPPLQTEFVAKFPKRSESLGEAPRFAAAQREAIGNQSFPPKASGWTIPSAFVEISCSTLRLGTTLEHTEARPVPGSMQSSWEE